MSETTRNLNDSPGSPTPNKKLVQGNTKSWLTRLSAWLIIMTQFSRTTDRLPLILRARNGTPRRACARATCSYFFTVHGARPAVGSRVAHARNYSRDMRARSGHILSHVHSSTESQRHTRESASWASSQARNFLREPRANYAAHSHRRHAAMLPHALNYFSSAAVACRLLLLAAAAAARCCLTVPCSTRVRCRRRRRQKLNIYI